MTTQTTNLNLWRPQIGGEEDNWGNLLNENADILDEEIAARLIADSNLSDLQSAQTARSNLGLGSAAVQSDTRYNHRSNNLSDVANTTAARQNIGAHNAGNLSQGFLPIARIQNNSIARNKLAADAVPPVVAEFTDTNVTTGAFTGGTVWLFKVGRQVTFQWSILAHASANNVVSGPDYIPPDFRPANALSNVYGFGPNIVRVLTVTSAGQLQFSYRDWSGSSTNFTNAGSGSMSWLTS